MRVFLTIDTEMCSGGSFEEAFARDIEGRTNVGTFGLRYQLGVLREYGLKATFFVEALFADAVGIDSLKQIVSPILEDDHEVQLHIHSEWLQRMERPVVPPRKEAHFYCYTEAEQVAMISRGIENLLACGAPAPMAFRAGNFGGMEHTLSALEQCGIRIDSSWNNFYLGTQCGFRTPLWQPRRFGGVDEYPVTCFWDWPGHVRHLQVLAVSFREMRSVLARAEAAGWRAVTIASHSFELLRNRRSRGHAVEVDKVVDRRFHSLCALLSQTTDLALFRDQPPLNDPLPNTTITTPVALTAERYVEQAWRHFSARFL